MQSLKRILLISVIVIAGTLIAAFIVGYLYRDEVKDIVVSSLNQRLTTKVDVENISFSLINNFPYPSITLNQVVVHESNEFITTGQVLTARQIVLILNFSSLFTSKYSLRQITVSDALVNLQIDESGQVNYKIWKATEKPDENQKELNIDLQNVTFKNTDVLYYNIQKNQDISFLITEGTLKGNFKSDTYALQSSANLEKAQVIIDEVRYLNKINCDIDVTLNVNRPSGSYEFVSSYIRSHGQKLNVAGGLISTENYVETDLIISTPSADLPSLISFIPEKYRGPTVEYNYSGRITFECSIKGKSGPDINPEVKINFESIDVNLNPKGSPYQIQKMNGKGFFTNKKSNTTPYTYLRLQNFSANLEGRPVKVNLEIENFKKPIITCEASLQANLNALSKFFMPDTLESVDGDLLADINFYGVANEKSTYQSSGEVKLNNVSFKVKQKPVPFQNLNGIVHLRGNDVMVENLSGKNGESDFIINGLFNNLIGFFLLENQKLDINASLQSKKINLDELMAKDTVSAKNDTIYKLSFSDKLKFRLEIIIGELQFKKFNATNIKGIVTLANTVLNTQELDFFTAGGAVQLSGTIDDRIRDSLRIKYIAHVNQLNIRDLFYEMGNFGQTVLIDKNLKGRVTADVNFSSVWSNRLEMDENSIKANGQITIENGELIDFEPMLALSTYLKGSDLKTIKFSTLTNTIDIHHRKIFIPMMEIKSSAADIHVSGDHSFDNIVNYKLRLYLSQLLGKKIKEQNTEFGTIEDDGLGRPMLFLTMTGPASEPKISLDMKGVETKITDEIRNETKTLKNILKNEFGKKDTSSSDKKPAKKKEELQIDYDDEE